jgi:hypothetical protein
MCGTLAAPANDNQPHAGRAPGRPRDRLRAAAHIAALSLSIAISLAAFVIATYRLPRRAGLWLASLVLALAVLVAAALIFVVSAGAIVYRYASGFAVPCAIAATAAPQRTSPSASLPQRPGSCG